MPKVVKGLVLGGGIIGLWWLWTSDAALNAVMQFCTAGVVPGTDVILSPAQMYWLLAVVLLVAVGLLFWRRAAYDIGAIGHAIRRRAQRTAAEAAAVGLRHAAHGQYGQHTNAGAEPAAQPAVLVARLSIASAATTTAAAELDSQAASDASGRPSNRLLSLAGLGAKLVGRWVGRLSWAVLRGTAWLGRRLAVWTLRGARLAARAGRWLTIKIVEMAVSCWWLLAFAWIVVSPYMRRFDRWIEVTLKKNKDIAALLHAGIEISRLMRQRAAAVRRQLARAVEKWRSPAL